MVGTGAVYGVIASADPLYSETVRHYSARRSIIKLVKLRSGRIRYVLSVFCHMRQNHRRDLGGSKTLCANKRRDENELFVTIVQEFYVGLFLELWLEYLFFLMNFLICF